MVEITRIHGGHVPGEADPEIVATLERLLEDARSGALVGFAYATVRNESGAVNNWALGTGWDGSSADGLRYRLGSAIHMLDHRYCEGMLNGE